MPLCIKVPLRAAKERLGQIGLAFAIFQIAAHVVVEERDVGRGDGRALRIVVGLLAERVDRGAGEARVEPAGGQVLVVLQGLLELAAVDAQVGLEQ